MTPPVTRASSVYAQFQFVLVDIARTDGDHTDCVRIPQQNQCQCPSRTEDDLVLCFRESCGGRSVLIRSHLCWNWRMRSRCCCRRWRAAAGPGASMRTCLAYPSGSGSLGLVRSRRSVAVTLMFTLIFEASKGWWMWWRGRRPALDDAGCWTPYLGWSWQSGS